MNKLLGFYELKWLGIPSISWEIFSENTQLDNSLLWSVRVAVDHGDDINLPRAIGVSAEEAIKKGRQFLNFYKDSGMVIYYPYFIALKSGIVEIKEKSVIIEAVKDDLWNLTTKGIREITVIIDRKTQEKLFNGNKHFLSKKEIWELFCKTSRIRIKYKDYIFDQSSVMVEWSYAVNTDINRKPIGDRYLVFYECRVISF